MRIFLTHILFRVGEPIHNVVDNLEFCHKFLFCGILLFSVFSWPPCSCPSMWKIQQGSQNGDNMGHLRHFKGLFFFFFFTHNFFFKVVFVVALTTPCHKIPQIVAAFLRLNNNNNDEVWRSNFYILSSSSSCLRSNNITSSVH